jgi:hypothetical protein
LLKGLIGLGNIGQAVVHRAISEVMVVAGYDVVPVPTWVIEEQRKSVEDSLTALKPGGLFLATFGYSQQTHWFEQSEQTNLSSTDAEWVYQTHWKSIPVFEELVAEYRLDLMELESRHSKRYGAKDYSFIVAGAELRK